MRAAESRRGALRALLLGLFLTGAHVAPAATPPLNADDDFLYQAKPRDTLIGIGKRLLVDPGRWREIQIRNHIVNPRLIPPGGRIRIPYAWLRMLPEPATAMAVGGTVARDGGAVAAGDSLSEGSTLRTGPDGSVTLRLADGSTVTLQKSSELRLERMQGVHTLDAAHDVRLKLQSGRLETVVKPHRDVGRFEISTPVAVSAVRGTQFRAGFESAGSHATTETLEGAVGVRGEANGVIVPAGFGTLVESGAPPLAPVSLLPAPDLAGLPAVSGGPMVHVEFPPIAGAQRYRVQASADSAFQTLFADLVAPTPSIEFAPAGDGALWVRARAIDRFGLEGTDAIRALVQHRLPDAPAGLAPAEGAKVTGDSVSLHWSADSVAPAQHYSVQIARDASFANPAFERSDLTTPDTIATGLGPGRYVWRVAARNGVGEAGPWSAPAQFMQRPPPPIPAAAVVERGRLRVGWDTRATASYRLQLASDPRFQHILATQDSQAAALDLRPPGPGTYYVRVQLVDDDGEPGPFGPARRFVVPLPLWAKVLLPIVILTPLL